MANIEAALAWMLARAGKVTYSMTYRNGPNSYDCSSAVSYALRAAGNDLGRIGNTESMFVDLPAHGWKEVQPNADGSIDAKRGDVFIWGDQGYTNGAFGHTGMFVDPDNIVHCNYGYNGISVNNHDYIWSANGQPTCRIWRYVGQTGADQSKQAEHVNFHPEPNSLAPYWVVEAGDTFNKIMDYYYAPGGWTAADARHVANYNAIVNMNLITPGQKIYIPGPIYWIVDPGDTWEKIASYYGYEDVNAFARRIGGPLTVGRKLLIWE